MDTEQAGFTGKPEMTATWTCSRCGLKGKLAYPQSVPRQQAHHDAIKAHAAANREYLITPAWLHFESIGIRVRRRRAPSSQTALF